MVNLAQRNIENGEKGFANASDYLETWDDSDSITAVNAQKKIWDILQNSGITTQKHNIKISTNYEHTEVVETELRLKSINPMSLRISNTWSW